MAFQTMAASWSLAELETRLADIDSQLRPLLEARARARERHYG